MRILAWVYRLVLQELEDLVEAHRNQSSDKRTDPVDPVLRLELGCNYAWPQAARRVEAAARVVHAAQFGNEKREPDAHRSNKGSPVLLRGQHEDREHELERENRFDEDTLNQADARGERSADV